MDEYFGLQKDGVYRHYKGNEYVIVGFARCSETNQIMVVYRRQGQRGAENWVRPAAMFAETVNKDGKEFPRFEFIGACIQSHFI